MNFSLRYGFPLTHSSSHDSSLVIVNPSLDNFVTMLFVALRLWTFYLSFLYLSFLIHIYRYQGNGGERIKNFFPGFQPKFFKSFPPYSLNLYLLLNKTLGNQEIGIGYAEASTSLSFYIHPQTLFKVLRISFPLTPLSLRYSSIDTP